MTTTKVRSVAWATEPSMQPFRAVRVFFRRRMWAAFCPECGWMGSATEVYRDVAKKARQHAHRGCPIRAQAAGRRPCSRCHGLGDISNSFYGRDTCPECNGRGSYPLFT